MLEYWDLDIFLLGDGRICEGFSPLCGLAPRTYTCHFFYCTYELYILRRIFKIIKNLATLNPEKLQGFMECLYPIVTPY
jgi:hypothetical protein